VLTSLKIWQHQLNVVIKVFVVSLPSQSFLGCHLGFHIFFHNGLLGRSTFLQLGCFHAYNKVRIFAVNKCLLLSMNIYRLTMYGVKKHILFMPCFIQSIVNYKNNGESTEFGI